MSINNFTTEKLVVPIDKIMPNRWNPNYMDKRQFEKLGASMEEYGFVGSTIVRKVNHSTCDYEILDGEHRWKAAKEKGYTEMAVECFKDKVSDEDAQVMTILYNNLRGQDDVFKRAKILEALSDKQLSLLPMSAEEIEHEKRFVKFDFSQYETEDVEKVNQFAKVVVLQLNPTEGAVWDKAKEELMSRGLIGSKNKKRQDAEMAMRLIRNLLGPIVFDEIIESNGVDNSVVVNT
jgi:ParB family chromosome partitioning protein